MAYRIHENVISGIIDCRIKGMVTGELWFVDRADPVKLELEGFPNPDLAGMVMSFVNPNPSAPLPYGLHPIQKGQTGDLTASRKNRVLDIPVEEAWHLAKQNLPYPEHLANVLYLEWYSERNGRVVIEIPEAEIKVEGPPLWQLTEAETLSQQEHTLDGLQQFIDLLSDSLEEDPLDEESDEDSSP